MTSLNKSQREPTPDERFKIRNILDHDFDDATGMYLHDMSDAAVAKKVGGDVTWGMVAKIRDAAYGPIRVDAAVAALRKQIDDLTASIEGDRKRQDEELNKLRAALDAQVRKQVTAS